MYTHIKQVQIIISLLKQNNIKHFVISPGTRHIPLVHSVEIDPFFTCYSVVDERSAAYIALGLAESINAPVCITCTSSTASCNYLPAIKEAYERNIPLIALTADRARYQRFHGENQCINQVDMYRPYCKYSVDLPLVKDEEDYWYCNRCVNEALTYQRHKLVSPIQINFLEPLSISELSTFEVASIPETRKIHIQKDEIDWTSFAKQLAGKKILVVCGQDKINNVELLAALKSFNQKFESVISTDYFANVSSKEFIHTPGLDNVLNAFEYRDLMPEIIISYGTKVYSSFGVRYRNYNIPHWYINEDGIIYDPMHSLQNVFKVSPSIFFEKISAVSTGNNGNGYYRLWKSRLDSLDFNVKTFTNYYVIKNVLSYIPENSNIHASVLNSMRFTNYCDLPDSVVVTGNICGDGIDGAFSSFLGQARCSKNISLLIIGDLSYLYDLNASFSDIPSNVRILLLNNHSGAEFHYNISTDRIPTLNQHISASHHNGFEEISEISNLRYLKVVNAKELNDLISKFFLHSDKPILAEVITDPDTDGRELRAMLSRNSNKVTFKKRVIEKLKRLLK